MDMDKEASKENMDKEITKYNKKKSVNRKKGKRIMGCKLKRGIGKRTRRSDKKEKKKKHAKESKGRRVVLTLTSEDEIKDLNLKVSNGWWIDSVQQLTTTDENKAEKYIKEVVHEACRNIRAEITKSDRGKKRKITKEVGESKKLS
ncbi:hypothetical protein S245_009571 [Arachis hypogaea]